MAQIQYPACQLRGYIVIETCYVHVLIESVVDPWPLVIAEQQLGLEQSPETSLEVCLIQAEAVSSELDIQNRTYTLDLIRQIKLFQSAYPGAKYCITHLP